MVRILCLIVVVFGAAPAFGTAFTLSVNEQRSIEPDQLVVCDATVVHRATFSTQPDTLPYTNGGTDTPTTFISTDAVPQLSVVEISSAFVAVLITAVHADSKASVPPLLDLPVQSALHHVLFESIISPNAP